MYQYLFLSKSILILQVFYIDKNSCVAKINVIQMQLVFICFLVSVASQQTCLKYIPLLLHSSFTKPLFPQERYYQNPFKFCTTHFQKGLFSFSFFFFVELKLKG